MRGRSLYAAVAMVLVATVAEAENGDRSGRAKRAALSQARALARLDPRLAVRLIDPDLAADRQSVRRLDAFIVREPDGELRPVIYVNYRSELLARAAAGERVDVIALAAVLHHEARHLDGASEAEARQAETAFFAMEVRRARLRTDSADEYLRLLASRDAHATQ